MHRSAQGILEYKRKKQRMQIDQTIQSFLDRFYMSRIGIRMLIGQHIALTEQQHRSEPDYVGIICTRTNVRELAQEAIENARFVCEDHYGLFDAPKIQLVCDNDLNFMYVPAHLSHMLFELLKNSLRAVVETHGQDKDAFPVTKVIVAEGKEDITIKISDEGGGIPRSAIPLVWTYMYTTVERTPSLDPDFDKSDFKAPMAGFGYGLPISRLYARYFGGDLKLISMEGQVTMFLVFPWHLEHRPGSGFALPLASCLSSLVSPSALQLEADFWDRTQRAATARTSIYTSTAFPAAQSHYSNASFDLLLHATMSLRTTSSTFCITSIDSRSSLIIYLFHLPAKEVEEEGEGEGERVGDSLAWLPGAALAILERQEFR